MLWFVSVRDIIRQKNHALANVPKRDFFVI